MQFRVAGGSGIFKLSAGPALRSRVAGSIRGGPPPLAGCRAAGGSPALRAAEDPGLVQISESSQTLSVPIHASDMIGKSLTQSNFCCCKF